MIIGNIASGRYSNSAKKSYARSIGVCSIQKKARFNQSITFSKEDLISIARIHDDALVVVGDIADFGIRTVLIDRGSTANVDHPYTMFSRDDGDIRGNCGASSHARHVSNDRGDHEEFLSYQDSHDLQCHLQMTIAKHRRCRPINLLSGHEVPNQYRVRRVLRD